MKRRPRVHAKPVIPPKEWVSKSVADVITSDSALEYRSLAISASVQVSSSNLEGRDALEDAVKYDTMHSGALTQMPDGSALGSFGIHGSAAQDKNKEHTLLGNLITSGQQNSESVSSTDQDLNEPSLNGVSGSQADVLSASDATDPQVPHSVALPKIEMSAECLLNGQKVEVVKVESLPSEKSVHRQLIDDSKESCETGLEDSGPLQKRRRFIRKQPNVVKNVQSCVPVPMNASTSSMESSAEFESPMPPHTAVESRSPDAPGNANSGSNPVDSVVTDAADDCKVPFESTKPSDGLEASHCMDTVDLCRSPVPMSPPMLSPKVRHHFTKVRPNLANCLTSKHSSSSERLPKVSASTPVDDGPFIPPPIAASRSVTCGLEEGVATEESVVVLPETVEKAAAKLIARKLKLKKKKRALENLDAPIDSSKVCMRDLIYMNPVNNPMKSAVAESVSSDSVKSSATQKKPPTSGSVASPAPDIEKVAAPQLKIGPDGSIIINEASLVIERQPLPSFDDTEAIDETDNLRCGYPKRCRTRSWTKKETRKFFAALSMIGTDFFLMMNLFPGRTRAELKRKFKREEKVHQAMVETALSDRRSLDMSLMAIQSSDEEDVKPRGRQPGKRCPRTNKKQPPDGSVDKGKLLGGKENDPQPVPVEKKQRKRKQEKQPGKKQKKKKSRYYDESSDEGEKETEEQLESGSNGAAESVAEEDDDHRTIAKPLSPHLSDEDDVEIVSCFSRRPTRSGRVPKPVKTYNPVTFSDLEASAVDSVPVAKAQPLSAKRKPESFKLQMTMPSPARSVSLMSPPPFMSPTRVPCASPRAMCSPLPFFASPSPYGSPAHAPILSPLVSCSPSSQMSMLAASIPGLENVPPGKQLMIVASPVMSGDSGEPPQQLFHVFMVSSPVESSDACNDGQDPVPMESTPNGNWLLGPGDSGLVAHSSSNRTREHCTSDCVIVSTSSQFENSSSSALFSGNVHTVANQNSYSRSNLGSRRSESFGTDTSRVSNLGLSKLDETLVSTLFPGRRQNDSTDLNRTHGTNASVSPILSTSALEYCMSQVANVAPPSLRFSESADDHESVDEDDIELEGNITGVLQQDDGTLVIIAESANVISCSDVPEMLPTDSGSDVKLQSMESVEIPLEKDSDGNGSGSTEQLPLKNRGGKEGEEPKAVDIKFEIGTDENGNEDFDQFIEVFIETMPDLDPTLLAGTFSGTETAMDADIMSNATNDKSNAAPKEELLDKVECQKELLPADKCGWGCAEPVEEKCLSGYLESVNAVDHTPRFECANESTDVNSSVGPLYIATEETTDINVSSGPMHNENNTSNNRFLNVVSLADGSIEIVLENGAWSSEGPDQERYLDIEFPFDDQSWIGCDVSES